MRVHERAVCVAVAAIAATASVAAQQPTVTIDDDDITIRGCVRRVDLRAQVSPAMLVWSRGDIMMAVAAATSGDASKAVGTGGVAGRVFYWLEDDEDLSKHVGQLVEVKGELEDFQKGEIEIERDGDFTEIELDFDGKEEKARIPTSWLGPTASNKDQEFDIVARKIDVEDVRVLGACNLP
jgi:hypothetical protein